MSMDETALLRAVAAGADPSQPPPQPPPPARQPKPAAASPGETDLLRAVARGEDPSQIGPIAGVPTGQERETPDLAAMPTRYADGTTTGLGTAPAAPPLSPHDALLALRGSRGPAVPWDQVQGPRAFEPSYQDVIRPKTLFERAGRTVEGTVAGNTQAFEDAARTELRGLEHQGIAPLRPQLSGTAQQQARQRAEYSAVAGAYNQFRGSLPSYAPLPKWNYPDAQAFVARHLGGLTSFQDQALRNLLALDVVRTSHQQAGMGAQLKDVGIGVGTELAAGPVGNLVGRATAPVVGRLAGSAVGRVAGGMIEHGATGAALGAGANTANYAIGNPSPTLGGAARAAGEGALAGAGLGAAGGLLAGLSAESAAAIGRTLDAAAAERQARPAAADAALAHGRQAAALAHPSAEPGPPVVPQIGATVASRARPELGPLTVSEVRNGRLVLAKPGTSVRVTADPADVFTPPGNEAAAPSSPTPRPEPQAFPKPVNQFERGAPIQVRVRTPAGEEIRSGTVWQYGPRLEDEPGDPLAGQVQIRTSDGRLLVADQEQVVRPSAAGPQGGTLPAVPHLSSAFEVGGTARLLDQELAHALGMPGEVRVTAVKPNEVDLAGEGGVTARLQPHLLEPVAGAPPPPEPHPRAGEFSIEKDGAAKVPGKASLGYSATADIYDLWKALRDGDPEGAQRALTAMGPERAQAVGANAGLLKERGVLDDAMRAHEAWQTQAEEAHGDQLRLEADRQQKADDTGTIGDALSRAMRQEAHYTDAEGARQTARYYELSPEATSAADRQAIADRMLATNPSLGNREWYIPGHGTSGLRDLVVDAGIVPAEIANRYQFHERAAAARAERARGGGVVVSEGSVGAVGADGSAGGEGNGFSSIPEAPNGRPLVAAPEMAGGSGKPPTLGELFGQMKQLAANNLAKRLGKLAEPQGNFNEFGAIRSATTRNLSQLEKADTPSYLAARQAAGSRAAAATMLRTTAAGVDRAMGPGGWDRFRALMVENELRGTADRWRSLAEAARNTPDEQMVGPVFQEALGRLKELDHRHGFGKVSQEAAAISESGNTGKLRAFMAQAYDTAARRVGEVGLPGADFEKQTKAPQFQEALKLYKENLEAPLARNHALNQGQVLSHLGPLDTYYPLTALGEDGEPVGGAGGGNRLQPFQRPNNPRNRFRTGLAESYDLGTEGLAKAVAGAMRANNVAHLLDTLEANGLVRTVAKGETPAEAFRYRGQDFRQVRVAAGPQKTIIRPGAGAFTEAQRSLVMPEWVHREIRPILEGQRVSPNQLVNLMHAVTEKALLGPADAIYHGRNLLGSLKGNTPFIGRSLVANSGPAKAINAVVRLIREDTSTPENLAAQHDLARLGLLPDRTAASTYSRAYAAATGAERKVISAEPFLKGPSGMDLKTRLILYRMAKEINPNATDREIIDFVGQGGNYVRGLQGELQRRLGPASPFFEAGKQMTINGVRALTGTTPLPASTLSRGRVVGLRVQQQLSGGAAGAVGLWLAGYKAYTGKFPWEDRRARLGQVPLNDRDRQSPVAQALYGKGHDTAYVDLWSALDPGIARGARALGVRGAADTLFAGGTPGQATEAAQKDQLNAVIHPFAGPPVRAAVAGTFGVEPYLTGLRDRQSGRPVPQFLQAAPTAKPGLPQVGAKLGAAAAALNPLAQQTFGYEPQSRSHAEANRWLRMIFGLALPGALGQAVDVPARQRSLQREDRATDRAIRKQSAVSR